MNFPHYTNPSLLQKTLDQIASREPLVSPVEIEQLKKQLQNTSITPLIIGECAETFDMANSKYVEAHTAITDDIRKQFPNFLVINRLAGQYCKIRSQLTKPDGSWSYFGDMINSKEAPEPDPLRLLQAYDSAHTMMNLFPKGSFFAHELAALDYEKRLIRDGYITSTHMVWIGYRTNQINSHHVELARSIKNPIGIKIGVKDSPMEIERLINLLNPNNESGKIILITRFGKDDALRLNHEFMEHLKSKPLQWIIDPQHGNTHILNDKKTRRMCDILQEVKHFQKVHKHHFGRFGGIHLECSPYNIYECSESDDNTDEPICDPRMNSKQLFESLTCVRDDATLGFTGVTEHNH
jgi:3-deoxy-7-phosphoheptulonate synthase